MDGYVTLRFIKLCKRLCMFAAFFGESLLFSFVSTDPVSITVLMMFVADSGFVLPSKGGDMG